MSDDFFAELEADIAKYVEADKLKRERDAAKKRANTMTLSPSIRAKASEEFRELNNLLAAQEWASIKTIALFTEQVCDGCGSTHLLFLQYMELQHKVVGAPAQRWIRVSKPQPEAALPRESLLQPMTTHVCASCCEEHGFLLLTANRLAPRQDAVTTSLTYHQEDINAQAA